MLFCTDFDGTLNDPNDLSVIHSNLLALSTWRQAGNYACLVTGRNYSVIPSILWRWEKYFDYLITDNGGAIYDNRERLILQYRFSPDLIDIILDSISDDVLPAYYYTHDYTADRNRYADQIPIKLRLWFRSLNQLWSEQHRFETEFPEVKSLPWPKPGFSPLDNIDLSKYCGFVDLVPQRSGKESSIQRLAKKLFLGDDIITVGDDFNDIAMLQKFEGYAIDTAPSEVIQAASGRTVRSVHELISRKLSSN